MAAPGHNTNALIVASIGSLDRRIAHQHGTAARAKLESLPRIKDSKPDPQVSASRSAAIALKLVDSTKTTPLVAVRFQRLEVLERCVEVS